MNDSDLQILKALLELSDRAKRRTVDLNKFIVDAWSLLDLLNSVPKIWIEQTRSLVNEIEDIYAFAQSKNERSLPQADITKVDSTLNRIQTEVNLMLRSS